MDTADHRILLTAKLFRGFADPTRLAILDRLHMRPHTVGDLVTATRCTQPNVSNHLRCLRECELVIAQQHGKQVVYHLADARVAQIIGLADALLADGAAGVAACQTYSAVAPSDTPEVVA